MLIMMNPFPFFGVETPGWAAWMLENKIYACKLRHLTSFLFLNCFKRTDLQKVKNFQTELKRFQKSGYAHHDA